MRLIIVHPIPSPYREPFFEELSRLGGLDLTVLYCARGATDIPDWEFKRSDYHYEVLPGREIAKSVFFNPVVVDRIRRNRPDVVVVWGWSSPTMSIALLAARLLGIRTAVFSDTGVPTYQALTRPALLATLMSLAKRLAIWPASKYIAQGVRSREQYIRLGATPDAVSIVPVNCLDICRWKMAAERARQEAAYSENGHRLSAKRLILYVGRLVRGKGLPWLLRAFRTVENSEPGTSLALIGDGPERSDLQSHVRRLGLSNVCFLGSQPYERLPRYFGIADCLVLPTLSDQWPLVVLESLACGVPVVTTERCGSIPDLIEGQGTGFVVDAENSDQLAETIIGMLKLPAAELLAMRNRSTAVAANYDCRDAATRFAHVLSS